MVVKICGNTNLEDVIMADKAGADFIGVVVEVSASRRSVSRQVAKELFKTSTIARKVMLLCNHSVDEALTIQNEVRTEIVHLTGDESPLTVKEILSRNPSLKIFKSLHLPAGGVEKADIKKLIEKAHDYKFAGASLIVLDASDPARNLFGGTGKRVDWDSAREFTVLSPLPVLLAGGITPENVCEAIKKVKPYGVDLASGVESEPGKKDPAKIKLLFDNIQKCLQD